MSEKYKNFIIERDDERRLDAFLLKFLKLPKSKIMRHIREGDIKVNGERKSFNYKLRVKEIVSIYKPLLREREERGEETLKTTLKENLDIVYEDDEILVLEKRAGILVHSHIASLDSLVNLYLKDSLKSLTFKPSAVHRLDRNTSGLIIFAKTLESSRILSRLFKERAVVKKYFAILEGELTQEVKREDFLLRDKKLQKTYLSRSKSAKLGQTFIKPLLNFKGLTLALLRIESGITHQIRAHCSSLGFPLLGDVKYGANLGRKSYFLHCFLLKLKDNLFKRNVFYSKPQGEFYLFLKEHFPSKDLNKIFLKYFN